MFWLTVIAGSALGAEPPNTQVVAHVAVVHALGQDHPWGVRIGAEWQFTLLDHCDYQETECYKGEVWPVAGPAGSLTWRGGPRFALEVDGIAGVGGMDMNHVGFLPRWELMGRAGLRFEFADKAASVVLGGFASKSFGIDVPYGENGVRTYGTHGMGLRFDVDTAWVFGDTWRPPVLAAGLWMFASPVASYF